MKRLLSFILVFLALAAPGKTRDHIAVDVSGTITQRTGALTDTPFLFNGAYGVVADSNGLLYMQARYYNPQIRRFINADPSGFSGGMHFYAFAGATPVLVHNTNPGERLYIVYQAPLRSGKIYTGPTSMGGSKDSISATKVLQYRFQGGHHRGIDFSKAEIVAEVWGAGPGSEAYFGIRGAEELWYNRAVENKVAARQIAPIRAGHENFESYIETAKRLGLGPCQ